MFAKAAKASNTATQAQKSPATESGVQYALNEFNRKSVAKRKKSWYSQFESEALKWAYKADRRVGDMRVLPRNGRTSALIEATENGYIILCEASHKEVQRQYELYYQRSSINGSFDDTAFDGRGVRRDSGFGEDGGVQSGFDQSVGEHSEESTGFATSDEYLRSDNQETLVSNTKFSQSDPVTDAVFEEAPATDEPATPTTQWSFPVTPSNSQPVSGSMTERVVGDVEKSGVGGVDVEKRYRLIAEQTQAAVSAKQEDAADDSPSLEELMDAFKAGMDGRRYIVRKSDYSELNDADIDGDTEGAASYLRNNLPRAYVDTRAIGNQITKEQLTEILDFAKAHNVQIGVSGKVTGGFETYCGDIEVLKSLILEVEKQEASELYKKSGAPKPILMYDNVLGYQGDNSVVDVDAFAVTRGKTITLNKFMFDDCDYMIKEYMACAEASYFVKGTDYHSIIAHEIGHIIDKTNPQLKRKILHLLQREAVAQGVTLRSYIREHVSIYATIVDKQECNTELLAEINSLLHKDENHVIIQLIKEGGALGAN